VTAPTALLAIRGLRAAYGKIEALKGVDLEINAGEIVALIGANGAGKSTTVKMLTGILVPSAGRIRVAGLDPSRDRVALARKVGVVFGQRTTLWWDLPLRDSFDLVRRLYRVDAPRYRRNLDRLVGLLELADLLDTPVRQLSVGRQQVVEIAKAMSYAPAVLLLDEPTSALAAREVGQLFTLIRRLRDRGVAVILISHRMPDVFSIADRVVVLRRGRKVADKDVTASSPEEVTGLITGAIEHAL